MTRPVFPERNLASARLSIRGHARRRNPPIFRHFQPQISHVPRNWPPPSGPFDTRRPGIRFQVEAAPLGRGVACDAAGRAGSLRGPRRVFLRAHRPTECLRKTRFFEKLHFIVKKLDTLSAPIYK
jgi:hypothetical protein